jgi:hypothetical protein
MLVTDKRRLQALNESESLDKSREETRAMQQAKGLFMDMQDELEDKELSSGQRMHWQDFIRLLEKACPTLLIRDGAPGSIAVYRRKRPDEEKEYMPGAADWYHDFMYVSGFAKDWLPEFSSVTTTDRGIANREQRGWRTVLVHLIQQRALTYNDAKRYFGEPIGYRGWRWYEALKDHYNKG